MYLAILLILSLLLCQELGPVSLLVATLGRGSHRFSGLPHSWTGPELPLAAGICRSSVPDPASSSEAVPLMVPDRGPISPINPAEGPGRSGAVPPDSSGPMGSLQILCLEAGNRPLSGVAVSLVQGRQTAADQVSDAHGRIVFRSLAPGRYEILPVPPAGMYLRSDAPVVQIGTSAVAAFLSFEKTATLLIRSFAGSDAEPLSDVSFTLVEDGASPARYTGVREADNAVRFPDLRDGIYTLEETGTPSGFVPSAPLRIDLHSGQSVVRDVYHVRAASLRFRILDHQNAPVAGARFLLEEIHTLYRVNYPT